MSRHLGIALLAVLSLLGPAAALASPCSPAFPDSSAAKRARINQRAPSDGEVRAQLTGLRVPFIANEGQTDPRVAYSAAGLGSTLFVTRQGDLVYALRARHSGGRAATRGARPLARSAGGSRPSVHRSSLTESLVEGRANPIGRGASPTQVSDFRGNDPIRWGKSLPTFDQLDLGEVWPGITVSLQARNGLVEKVFTVSPGASVDQIRVRPHPR